jgi:hypothetical protein
MLKTCQSIPSQSSLAEPARRIPLAGDYDVITVGSGPAGVCAAIAAGRAGARVLLLEAQGCLGGVWTSGLLSLVLDAGEKDGLIREIRERLHGRGAASARWLYDAEEMKLLLEEMCAEAGVEWILHSRVVAAGVEDGRLRHVTVENKAGRQAFAARVFIDGSGDGDLAALAGCEFEFGHPESGLGQPMTLMALVTGVPRSIEEPGKAKRAFLDKESFRRILLSAGHDPSYAKPSLFEIGPDLFCLMIHHSYELSGLDPRQVTRATTEGRAEVMRAARQLRENVPGWEKLRVVATAHHVGVREGRRIHGHYRLTAGDLLAGARFEDGICEVKFPVDVHALKKADGGGYSSAGVRVQPYQIPYRSLVARDVQGLLLAGRCLSGDFFAHASYRVTGNACVTGEAAGRAAAFCAAQGLLPEEITWREGAPVRVAPAAV